MLYHFVHYNQLLDQHQINEQTYHYHFEFTITYTYYNICYTITFLRNNELKVDLLKFIYHKKNSDNEDILKKSIHLRFYLCIKFS